jgi:hypothetical protein
VCGYKDTEHGTRTTSIEYDASKQNQRTVSTCNDCGHKRVTVDWAPNTCSHSWTSVCTTSHNNHNKKVSQMGTNSEGLYNWGCNKHGRSGVAADADKTVCAFSHVRCSKCGGQAGYKVCAGNYGSKYTSKFTCPCGSSHTTGKWRCSNVWCRTYWTGSAFKDAGAW